MDINAQSHDVDDRSWNVSFLRKEFREQHLESLFDLYVQKISHGYFSLFLILQIILSVTHISVLAAINMKYIDCLLPDVLCYCVIAILSIIALFMKESVGKSCTVFPLTVTITSLLILIFCDLFVPLYHATYAILLRPAYTTHLIIACYVFLPISDNFQAFIFGFSVTLCHLFTLGFVTYNRSHPDDLYLRLGSDAIYLACINGLGLYFRFVNEILKRRTFLDRRACVESTLKLKYEKEQEEQLMLSILPQHIAKRVRDDIMKTLQQSETKVKYKPFRNLYIEKHDNVTILFADIVNYTEMTRSLPVKTLVETLNELFGKFDDASENHDVLRIKFLGDCYYCVSGLPDPNPDHAMCCVELGLDMISIIQKLRAKKNLNIDMRIGVHSGSLYSGLIGECKWQYDIWSTDVLIANHMESSGDAGKVHVTRQTLNQLKGRYRYISSNCQNDIFLNKYNIEGFLISPQPEERQFSSRQSESAIGIYDRRVSVNVGRNFARPIRSHSVNIEATSSAISHRRTAFMDNRVKKLQIQLKEIENSLEEAIEKLPLRKFEQWFKSPGINPLFLTFRNLKMEFPYLVVPDPLFKYYLLSSVFVLLAIFLIQNLTMPIWSWGIWLMFVTLALLICIFIPATWLYTVYKKFFSKSVFQQPNCFVQFVRYTAGLVSTSVWLRGILYLTVSLLIAACTILDLVDCDQYVKHNKTRFNNSDEEKVNDFYCIDPWHMSQTCCLAVIASFVFLRTHLGLKFLIGTAITLIFSHFIRNFKDFFGDETWNPYLKPQIACIMSLTFLTFTLHLIDRQAEYLRRLDFQWKMQLTSEQIEAQKMHKINNMLLSNILPIHVVEVYLNTNIPADEPYNEEYKSVAVMFASILPVDFGDTSEIGDVADPEETLLTVMNEIISEFDMLLTKPCGQKVEKIKLAKWTYMAACGLDPGRKDSNTSIDRLAKDNIVVQMVRFAVNMMRVLSKIDSRDTFQTEQFKLRIGISHGEVTAGVVGSKKPLYDIWGDTVNTASRMDTTGQEGKIQVTEHTARILQKQGIACTYRAMTVVKGVGIIPTYFVDLESEESLEVIDRNVVR